MHHQFVPKHSLLSLKVCEQCGVLAACVRYTLSGKFCSQCKPYSLSELTEHRKENPSLDKKYSYSDII